jgi:hypothetical protein
MMLSRQILTLLGMATVIVFARPASAACPPSPKAPYIRADLASRSARVGEPFEVRWSSKTQQGGVDEFEAVSEDNAEKARRELVVASGALTVDLK